MKILYLSHCDWDWPRQRPQHIAVALAESGHDVHVRYRRFLRRSGLVAAQDASDSVLSTLRPSWSLVASRVVTTNRLLLFIPRLAIRLAARRIRPDVVWFSSAELAPIAEASGVPLVWDCMDLTSLMRGGDQEWSRRMRRLEGLASESADLVVTSSEVLRREVTRRSGVPSKVKVVNNGCLSSMEWPTRRHPSGATVAAYFGTVAEWFDFDLVMKILESEPDLEFRIFGPSVVDIPAHPRLRYMGVVAHTDLPNATSDVDIFMMPFRVTKMIEAVDPVKLYEYVASGRPAIAPRYREVEKFQPFVDLYASPSECIELVRRAKVAGRDGGIDQARVAFLESNSWAERVRDLQKSLEGAARARRVAGRR